MTVPRFPVFANFFAWLLCVKRVIAVSGSMEQFEQLLTCAICLDRYRNPKLLPCQHSFCMEPCMDGLVDYVRRQVKCPECRAEHRIPYQVRHPPDSIVSRTATSALRPARSPFRDAASSSTTLRLPRRRMRFFNWSFHGG